MKSKQTPEMGKAPKYGNFVTTLLPEKVKALLIQSFHGLISSGGWIRTNDFWVMSPTSYLCSTPQYFLGLQRYTYFSDR